MLKKTARAPAATFSAVAIASFIFPRVGSSVGSGRTSCRSFRPGALVTVHSGWLFEHLHLDAAPAERADEREPADPPADDQDAVHARGRYRSTTRSSGRRSRSAAVMTRRWQPAGSASRQRSAVGGAAASSAGGAGVHPPAPRGSVARE